jgi:hypothetical protein
VGRFRCVAGWATFTPYAAPADVQRLMQVDLSCLTRWRSCVTQGEIMPIAWAQYLAERPLVDGCSGELACSPSFLEVLGRDSVNIAIVEVLKYHREVGCQGYEGGCERTPVKKAQERSRLDGSRSQFQTSEPLDTEPNHGQGKNTCLTGLP